MTLENKAMTYWDITPMKSANQSIKYLHACLLPVPPDSLLPWAVLVLTQAPWNCPHPPRPAPGLPIHPQASLMPNWGFKLVAKTSLIFNNYVLLQQDTYLLQTFLKQMPVKICFQNNLATITDTNKNWPEKCFLIHPNLQSLGFFSFSDGNC